MDMEENRADCYPIIDDSQCTYASYQSNVVLTKKTMHENNIVGSTHATPFEIFNSHTIILVKWLAIFKVINAHTFLEANKNPIFHFKYHCFTFQMV